MNNPDRWTKQEMDFLTTNYADMTAREIANKLNRTLIQIEQKAYKMGLRKTTKNVVKSEERIKLIRQLLNMVRKSAGLPLFQCKMELGYKK